MVTAVDLIAQIVESGYDVTISTHRNGYYGQVWKEANEGGPRDSKQAVIMCETASTITAVVWGLYQQWKGYKKPKEVRSERALPGLDC